VFENRLLKRIFETEREEISEEEGKLYKGLDIFSNCKIL
jgi:hypothetical protein